MEIGVQALIAFMLSSVPHSYLAFWATADKAHRPLLLPIQFLLNEREIRSSGGNIPSMTHYLVQAPPAWLVPAYAASCLEAGELLAKVYAVGKTLPFFAMEYLAAAAWSAGVSEAKKKWDALRSGYSGSSDNSEEVIKIYERELWEILSRGNITDMSDSTNRKAKEILFSTLDENFDIVFKYVESAAGAQHILSRLLRVSFAAAHGLAAQWQKEALYHPKDKALQHLAAISLARADAALYIAHALLRGDPIPYHRIIAHKRFLVQQAMNNPIEKVIKQMLTRLAHPYSDLHKIREELENTLIEYADDATREIYSALYVHHGPSKLDHSLASAISRAKVQVARLVQQIHLDGQSATFWLNEVVNTLEQMGKNYAEDAIELAFLSSIIAARAFNQTFKAHPLAEERVRLVRALLKWLEVTRSMPEAEEHLTLIDAAMQYLLVALPAGDATHAAKHMPLSDLILPWIQAHFAEAIYEDGLLHSNTDTEKSLRAIAALSTIQAGEGWGYAGKRWDDEDARRHAEYLKRHIHWLPTAFALLSARYHVTGTVHKQVPANADTQAYLDLPAWVWAYLLLSHPFLYKGLQFSGHIYEDAFVYREHPIVERILLSSKMKDGMVKMAYLNIAMNGEKNTVHDLLRGTLSKYIIKTPQDLVSALAVQSASESEKQPNALLLGL